MLPGSVVTKQFKSDLTPAVWQKQTAKKVTENYDLKLGFAERATVENIILHGLIAL